MHGRRADSVEQAGSPSVAPSARERQYGALDFGHSQPIERQFWQPQPSSQYRPERAVTNSGAASLIISVAISGSILRISHNEHLYPFAWTRRRVHPCDHLHAGGRRTGSKCIDDSAGRRSGNTAPSGIDGHGLVTRLSIAPATTSYNTDPGPKVHGQSAGANGIYTGRWMALSGGPRPRDRCRRAACTRRRRMPGTTSSQRRPSSGHAVRQRDRIRGTSSGVRHYTNVDQLTDRCQPRETV